MKIGEGVFLFIVFLSVIGLFYFGYSTNKPSILSNDNLYKSKDFKCVNNVLYAKYGDGLTLMVNTKGDPITCKNIY